MRQHVQDALYIYEVESDNYRWSSRLVQTGVDNFTNCIMLIEAIYPTDRGTVDSALSNRMWNLGERNSPAQTLINAINNNLAADKKEVEWNYARYWHGYLIFMKPLLYAADPGTVRVLNFQIQFLLICLTFILIYKRLGSYYVLTFAMTLVAINPVTTALSFQNSTMLYITLLAVIFLLLNFEQQIVTFNSSSFRRRYSNSRFYIF